VRTSTPAPTKLALLATLAVTGAALVSFAAARPHPVTTGFAAPFLWLFSVLFLVRVVGQLVVRLRRPRWLPPTEEWNLTPYHLLLPTQILIVGIMAWIDLSFSLGRGEPVDPRPGLGVGVLAFAGLYAGVMALRYVIRMGRRRDQRWFGGTIPIVFHQVLAGYLAVFGSFHASH
jgi:hypothetical protein